MAVDAIELLTRAKSKIADPKHWLKGRQSNSTNTSFCSIGALHAANREIAGKSDPMLIISLGWRTLQRVVAENTGTVQLSIPHWNDNPTTTHEDVMAAFDTAIAFVTKERAEYL